MSICMPYMYVFRSLLFTLLFLLFTQLSFSLAQSVFLSVRYHCGFKPGAICSRGSNSNCT